MYSMKKMLSLTLALVMALTLAAACGGGGAQSSDVTLPSNDMPSTYNPNPTSPGGGNTSAAASEPQYGGVVKWIDVGATGGTAEPFGFPWTPIIATNYSTVWSECLVNYTQEGVYEPHLAESWEIDTDAHTITFKLREGIQFTDGSPFNAEAVAWNVNRWPVDGRGNEEIVEPAKVLDEYVVEIPYKNWQNVLFETFASHSYSMVSMQNVLDHDADYAKQHPVGTGPFILDEWVPGSHIKFVRNDNYWMEGKPYLDGVEYYEILDTMTQNATLLSAGEDAIDMYQCGDAEQAYTLISQGADFDASYMRAGGTVVLDASSENTGTPLADLKVRQAIAYALDREALVDAKGFGILQPAYQITPEGFAGHLPSSNPNIVTYDLDKAKALMTEAGYADGFSTTLYAASQFQDIAVIIQSQLAEIGINLTLEFPEPGRLTDLQVNGWDGILVVNFGQIMNTGISYYIWYHPDQDSYVSVIRPDEYEDMYYEARRSFDVDNDLFGRLNNLVLEYMTMIPVYHSYSVYFARTGLKDHGFHKYSADTIWTPWNAYWEAGSPELG
jgi:peptide/nickel transport system substrate-binding protein